MKLSELFPMDLFDQMVAAGYIRTRIHPSETLMIANYSEKAQYDNVWNAATLHCRGLIFDPTTLDIHARPFTKFFNYGDDRNTGPVNLDEPAVVLDKVDGSLGIYYRTKSGPAIATRGSFTSEQAIHATKILRTKYNGWEAPLGWTPLFEIVYPENRIVLDYNGLDDLVLLDALMIKSGVDLGHPAIAKEVMGWPGLATEEMHHVYTLGQALTEPPRPNAEGFVVRLHSPGGKRVKVKQADYVALHRIITGTSTKTVWQWLVAGLDIEEQIAGCPAEIREWVSAVAAELTGQMNERLDKATAAFDGIMAYLNNIIAGTDRLWTRSEFAQLANESEYRGYLFLLFDHKPQRAVEKAWRDVEPVGTSRPMFATGIDGEAA